MIDMWISRGGVVRELENGIWRTKVDEFEFKLEFYEDDAGEYRWRLAAINGNIVATSGEGYANREDCRDIANKIFLTTFQPEVSILW